MTDSEISQLQALEQGLQNLNLRKQKLHSQLVEIDSAVEQAQGASETYKIIGNVMVKADPVKLRQELEEKRQHATVRIEAIENQETQMRDKAKKIQQDVMSKMERENNGKPGSS